MISLADYWMGRDQKYPAELTDEIRSNATLTVERVNSLIVSMQTSGLNVQGRVSSGWRPAAVNAATKGAAQKSKHMTGQACDLADPQGALDAWCEAHLDELERIGLWLESPASTPNWCHVQTVAPRSGNRVFRP